MKALVSALIGSALLAGSAMAQAQGPSLADQAAQRKAYAEAVNQAKASLPVFWARMADNPGGPTDYSLKVAYASPQGGVEDIWLSDIKRQGGHIVGRVNYDPDTLAMHAGQIAPIPEDQIVDWSFKEGRKRYGQFTTRVLAKMNPEEAAKTMATLSDNPLPSDARK